jgi:hypothetical protein
MEEMESERGEQGTRQQFDISGGANPIIVPRDGDRRGDGITLFGSYQGPERRSGRDRREG